MVVGSGLAAGLAAGLVAVGLVTVDSGLETDVGVVKVARQVRTAAVHQESS